MTDKGETATVAKQPAVGVGPQPGTSVTAPPGTATVAANKPSAKSDDAELCATLHKALANNKRIIALVVRAKDHKEAETFADAQIQTIATKIEAAAKVEAANPAANTQADATKAATNESVDAAIEHVDPDGDADELIQEGEEVPVPEGAPKVQYTSSALITDIHQKSNNLAVSGLGSVKQITKLFEDNYAQLQLLEKHTTWLVPEPNKAASVIYYDDGKQKPQNKTVVVVRSALFVLPSESGAQIQRSPILVCSIPASSITTYKLVHHQNSISHYTTAFEQTRVFVEHYNPKNAISADKIERIALAYPKDLYKLYLDADASAKKKQSEATAKATKPKKTNANGNPVAPVAETEEELRKKEMSFYWLSAVDHLKKKLQGIDVMLMYSKHEAGSSSSPYNAPPRVAAYFAGGILDAFPTCAQQTDPVSGTKLALEDVSKTLFVCDRAKGKYVGNDNDDETSGGTFGKWVPMHFTSTRINADIYEQNAQFDKLICVIPCDAVPPEPAS
jgi:hypothetical protein